MCLEEEEVGLVACTMRRIWLRRNSFIFEKKFECPRSLLLAAKQNMDDFRAANVNLKPNHVDTSLVRWEKPDTMVCKVNWDAALDVKNKKVGIGVIIRDSEGEILACLCSMMDAHLKPVMAEGHALRRAMNLSGVASVQCDFGGRLTGNCKGHK
ncbi:uncharacterized protein LOC118344698 [Juglans regia]|uniref:Uncharacterized protein LOC118344698 n=1 Tax=Juglans regia TaxID=51240 RepID=A0A6P9E0Y7_JUGRE|nr:uncharacterized protein LOC118344698 [Juglans regia]